MHSQLSHIAATLEMDDRLRRAEHLREARQLRLSPRRAMPLGWLLRGLRGAGAEPAPTAEPAGRAASSANHQVMRSTPRA